MDQARRAVREERYEDAQALLVNIVVREPENDEAWLLLASVLSDPERKLECLEHARRINPRNPATVRAIQQVQAELANAAFRSAVPLPPAGPPEAASADERIGPLLAYMEMMAQAVIMTTDPADTRKVGQELVHMLERALGYDERQARRWARSVGRQALLKYEKALSAYISGLPQHDRQLPTLRAQRQRALDLLR